MGTTVEKKYSIINLLITVGLCTASVFILGYMQEQEIFAKGHKFTPFIVPAAAGLTMALGNVRKLSKLALLFLPLVFALSLVVAFAGVIFAGGAELKQGDSNIIDLVINQVPFFFASYALYKGYTMMAGKKSFIIFALHAAMTVMLSFLIFRQGQDYGLTLLQTAYYGATALLFSLLHFGK